MMACDRDGYKEHNEVKECLALSDEYKPQKMMGMTNQAVLFGDDSDNSGHHNFDEDMRDLAKEESTNNY